MESEVFIMIIKLILDRADNLRSRCFSEAQVHKALHLIGICLLEEDRPNQETKVNVYLQLCMTRIKRSLDSV